MCKGTQLPVYNYKTVTHMTLEWVKLALIYTQVHTVTKRPLPKDYL